MRLTIASKIVLVGGALLGSAFLLNGCVTDTNGNGSIDTNGIGGSSSQAGNTSYAGYTGDDDDDDAGGYAGSAGSTSSGNDVADVRFVNLIPDSSFVDICLRAVGGSGTWNGPLASRTYQIGNDQFYYPAITRYSPLPVGTWNIRLVEGNAVDCDTPVAGTADQSATFTKDVAYSVVLEGLIGGGSYSLRSVTDRGDPASSNATGWQAVNALTSQGSVDLALLDNNNNYVDTIIENVTSFTTGNSGDFAPSSTHPAFLLNDGSSTVVALGPDVDAQAGQVHAVFLHGKSYSDAIAPATTIICNNFTTIEDRSAYGQYTDEVNHKFLEDSQCFYYTPEGQLANE